MAYLFNKITVRPKLPERINKLYTISYNVWWSWNTDFLRLFKDMDGDLWERCDKNPVKFLKLISQDKLEKAAMDMDFLRRYDKIVRDFEDYMDSKSTWFTRNHPDHVGDLIAYFSMEYGLDETVAIYSGGLGILSGDHMKSSSDLGIPLIGIGLLYKHGYFHQIINGDGKQEEVYKDIDIDLMPITPVKDEEGNEVVISIKLPDKRMIYIKAWQIKVGRNTILLLDSDIDENKDDVLRTTTTTLYGGDQDMRIRQEICLGMGGVQLLRVLGYTPNVYHMNEGHSSFLTIELIKDIMKEKKVTFDVARDIVSSMTAFTTHTPVPAGNDIFGTDLILKYFDGYWNKLGITKEEFLQLGMQPDSDGNSGFNMGILALKIAGKKNGVSKLHGAVSRELFDGVWKNVPANESPIGYVTNGVHTCTWLSPKIKELFNSYLKPYWQDSIESDDTWKDINRIPNEELWNVHLERKAKLLELVKASTINRLRRYNYSYDEIDKLVGSLDVNALTIGFARRFATYKRATLIFKDLERITKIFNEQGKKIQIIFAGKAHPHDREGKEFIRYIHELSVKPQFKGKIFILENYNIGMSRYLVSGVDVWLNNPRRPLEASGTSGQKAAINGVINFSVLDGWWAEGYNQKNGWAIGTNEKYQSYEEQDSADSKSIYDTLENKIVPTYYDYNGQGFSDTWVQIMKNSIISNAGKYSTARMLQDYVNNIYIPLSELHHRHYLDIENANAFNIWKKTIRDNFDKIEIIQSNTNLNDITIDAGNQITVKCDVKLPEGLIDKDSIIVQAYYGQIDDNGVIENVRATNMYLEEDNNGVLKYRTEILLKEGGDIGYTFRVIPKTDMVIDIMDLDLIKWVTK